MARSCDFGVGCCLREYTSNFAVVIVFLRECPHNMIDGLKVLIILGHFFSNIHEFQFRKSGLSCILLPEDALGNVVSDCQLIAMLFTSISECLWCYEMTNCFIFPHCPQCNPIC